MYPVVGKAGRHQKGKDNSEHTPKAAPSLLPNPHVAEYLLVHDLKLSICSGQPGVIHEQGG